MKKSISIEMDFVVAQRILSNQEKLKNQLRSKKHTSIVKKETDIEDKRYKSYSDCIKCGQSLIWCYCMFY